MDEWASVDSVRYMCDKSLNAELLTYIRLYVSHVTYFGGRPKILARGQGHLDHMVRNQYIWFSIFVQIPQCIYDTGGERWGGEGVLVNHMPPGMCNNF